MTVMMVLVVFFFRFLALRFCRRRGLTRTILKARSALEHLCMGSGGAGGGAKCETRR